MNSLSFGADTIWINTSGGNFTNPANWSAGVPTPADTAVFNDGSSYVVTFTTSTNSNVGSFNKSGGTVTLDIGSGNTWTLGNNLVIRSPASNVQTVQVVSGQISVANGLQIGQGRSHHAVIISNGAVVKINQTGNVGGFLAADPGGFNLMVVTGEGSVFENRSYFDVGANYSSNATIIVEKGGQFRNGLANNFFRFGATSNNTVIIRDSGSVFTNASTSTGFIIIGGNNRFIVSNGAHAVVGQQIQLGGVNNQILVTGSNSVFRTTAGVNADLIIDSDGTSSLVVWAARSSVAAPGWS